MKITFICDVLGQENNGTTIAAMNLIRSLKEKGHDLKVVCMDKDKENLEGFYIVPEMNLLFLNPIIHRNGVSLARTDKKILYDVIKDCDIVHLLLPFPLSISALKIAREMHKPVTASFHCQAENFTVHLWLDRQEWANNFVYKFFYKHVYSKVDAIHYPTNFIRGVFEEHFGPTNGYVISNGVNDIYRRNRVDKPEHLKDKFVVLSIGRLCGEKKHDILMKGIANSKYKDKKIITTWDKAFSDKVRRYYKI